MNSSNNIYNLSKSLCKAQKKFKTAIKKSTNPYFRSKYADYAEVLNCVKEALNEEGISILQPIKEDCVETVLLHESGEWISSLTKILMVPSFVKNKQEEILHTYIKPQDYGSAVTYARRYGLSALLAIDSDEDDDGNNANGNNNLNPPTNKKDSKKEQELSVIRQRILKLYQSSISKEQIERALGFSLNELPNYPIDEIRERLDEFEKTL